VIERDEGTPAPKQFHSIAAGVFPVYHVLAAVGAFTGGEILRCDATQSLTIAGLVLRKQNQIGIILANLTPELQQVVLDGWLAGEYDQRRLDETNTVSAMENPERFLSECSHSVALKTDGSKLELPPYGLVFLNRKQAPPR
jgi:hypothetical protein